MKKLAIVLVLLFSAALCAAQSASFAFGPVASMECSPITAWNGASNYDGMGEVCFNLNDYPYSGMLIPFQLGFPNNGYLLDETPFTWSGKVFTSGNATTDGSTYAQTGSAFYADYGVNVNVSVDFTVHVVKQCGRGVCRTAITNTLTGGNGSVWH